MPSAKDYRLLQRLVTQWNGVVSQLRVLNRQVVVVPEDGWEVFKMGTDQPVAGSTSIDMNPVALQVPERGDDPVLNIYIALSGYLYFDTQALKEGRLIVTNFGTRVAYFRRVQERFDHVFGAHFDFAENELGHPVFHGQMKNLQHMFDVISSQLNVAGNVESGIPKILSTVRVPTAQLDVFSLLLQVFADHLLTAQSTLEEKAAFNELLNLAAAVRGAGYLVGRLAAQRVETCMCARHWYAAIA